MKRKDFQQLARVRLTEAKALLKAGLFAGAYYLAGYVIKCALKACIAKATEQYDFPPDKKALENIYTHDLKRLVVAADLGKKLDEAKSADASFASSWALATTWSEAKRYELSDEKAARDLLIAVSHIRNGVFKWIKTHW